MQSEKQSHRTFTSMCKPMGLQMVVSLIALIGFYMMPQAAMAQLLQIECYTFDALTVGDRFEIGDSIPVQNATINITDYFRNGTPVSPDPVTQRAEVVSSMRAGGNAPELLINLVNVQVVPNDPVFGVSIRYGRSGDGARFANLGINGELAELDGDIADFDNMILDDAQLGRVLVRVFPDSTGTVQMGRMELYPLTGAICRRP